MEQFRAAVTITVSPADRRRLLAVIKDSNAPEKHEWCAEIVLLSAGGAGTNAIRRQTGKSKTFVWRWLERFATEGFEACCVTRRGLPASSRWAMTSPHGLPP